MAKRHTTDPEIAKQWTLRAVALSGKSRPLMSYADSRTAKYFQRDPDNGERKSAYRLDALSDRYVMNEIAHHMGDPRARADHWRSELAPQGSVERLSQLDAQINQLLTELDQVQNRTKSVNHFASLVVVPSES